MVQGEYWDWDSTVQLFSAGVFATTTAVSVKGLANDLSNYSSVKYDIQTSQCFVEGTPVLTNEGNKPIEEIRAGDLVYATNPETGESGYKEVLRTFRKESDVLIHVFVNGEEIETTAVHPFWVENRWVSAKDLKEGDMLTLAGGSAARIAGVYGEKLDEAVVVGSESGSNTINPRKVNFMQSSIKNQTGRYTVLENAETLRNGTLNANDLPNIKICEDADGTIWTLDHRRLAAFRIAGLDEVPFQWVTQ